MRKALIIKKGIGKLGYIKVKNSCSQRRHGKTCSRYIQYIYPTGDFCPEYIKKTYKSVRKKKANH